MKSPRISDVGSRASYYSYDVLVPTQRMASAALVVCLPYTYLGGRSHDKYVGVKSGYSRLTPPLSPGSYELVLSLVWVGPEVTDL